MTQKTHAIVVEKFGGPKVLEWQQIDLPDPAPGEALVRHTAIGLNFIDTYHRSGLYPLDLPIVPGSEAAGVVEAVGEGVTDVMPGDRVVYTGMPIGSYSERRCFAADRLVELPDSLDDNIAAAIMLKGLTAWYLLFRSYAAQPGDTVLAYAAAGGVGSILCQWANALGVIVIGVVGNEEKAVLARENGCSQVVLQDDPEFVARVRELAGGGVAAVYDSVGKDTFFQSLDCLAPHGCMVSYGNATGAVEPFAPLELTNRGSLYVTRPKLFDFIETREELVGACEKLFPMVTGGKICISINQTYPLADAATAHADLEARRTTGCTVLVP